MVTLSSHLSTPVTGWLLRTLGYFFPEPIFGTTWDRKCVLTFKGRGEEEKLRSEQPSGKLIWPSHPTLIIGNKSVKKHWPWPIAQTCSLQYKVIHRSHITQSKMFKLGLSNTGFCSKCTLGSTDAHLHAIWLCQPVHSFWITVTETLSTILSYRIPSSPTLCFLGDISEIHIPQKHRNPLLISVIVAKKVVLQNWKSNKSCHIYNWTNLISEYISMERYNAHRKKQISTFGDTWSSFLTFINSTKT